MSANELYTLLYNILDKLERIETHLGIENNEVELDGGLKFSIVPNDEKETVIEFPKRD